MSMEETNAILSCVDRILASEDQREIDHWYKKGMAILKPYTEKGLASD